MSALIVDVLCGGPGREAEVSRRSGAAIAEGLRCGGHDVRLIEVGQRLDAAALRPGSVVFNIIHGTYGEDGTLQAELEALGRRFVGSDSAVSRLCMDKQATKQRLAEAGVRVPWGVAVRLGTPFRPSDFKLPHLGPLVMKPRDDGSSVGLRMVPNPSFLIPAAEELLREVGDRAYLIEERLSGPEYTCAVLGDGDAVEALPPIAIAAAGGVFDYHAKYHAADTREVPVGDPSLAQRLMDVAVQAHRACGCRDLSRTDIMGTADGGLAVLEINTLPGFTGASLTPKAAAAAGIAFPQLVDRLVRRAAARGIPR